MMPKTGMNRTEVLPRVDGNGSVWMGPGVLANRIREELRGNKTWLNSCIRSGWGGGNDELE